MWRIMKLPNIKISFMTSWLKTKNFYSLITFMLDSSLRMNYDPITFPALPAKLL